MALSSSTLAPEDVLFDRSPRTLFRIGFDRAMGWLLPLLFLVAILPILDLVYFVTIRGAPGLSWYVLTCTYPCVAGPALGTALIGTFELMLLGTLLAVVLGVFGGVATAELLSDRTASWVRSSANMLAGTPSVVVGYFGFFMFAEYFGWGLSFGAATLTLAFFMTPYVFRTADLAFTSVPRPIREAALGSGAGPAQYVTRVALPIAFPQILTGVFLAMAIGVGETAPIVLTTTVGVIPPHTWTSPVTFLTAVIWANYNGSIGQAYLDLAWHAAFVLIVVVVSLNIVVRIISARYQKRLEGLYQ